MCLEELGDLVLSIDTEVCSVPIGISVSNISRAVQRTYREGESALGMFVLVTLHR